MSSFIVYWIDTEDNIDHYCVDGHCSYMNWLDQISFNPNLEWIGTVSSDYGLDERQYGCTDKSTMTDIRNWVERQRIERQQWEQENPTLVGKTWDEIENETFEDNYPDSVRHRDDDEDLLGIFTRVES